MGGPAPEALALDVAADADAPRLVRNGLRAVDGISDVLGDALFLASELVSVVVQRDGCSGRSLVQVRVRQDAGGLLISVQSPSVTGRREQAGGEAPPAVELGLRMVEQVADEWGIDRVDGYRIWAWLSLE